tara:strand:- start:5198 stop:5464 length:267 start_codon:yes stop_codon:yes gene_type:complete
MAQQLEIFEIPSPCKGICQVNARGYCLGCARSREERFNWQKLDDGQKREVLRLCQSRFARARRKQTSKQEESLLDSKNSPIQLDVLDL